MSVVTSKETVFVDELIRENARLTVQHEADMMTIEELKKRLDGYDPKSVEASVNEALGACSRAQERARIAEVKLSKAVADLHFVMAAGDPCKVCSVKCAFGEGHCKPVWRGEVESE